MQLSDFCLFSLSHFIPIENRLLLSLALPTCVQGLDLPSATGASSYYSRTTKYSWGSAIEINKSRI